MINFFLCVTFYPAIMILWYKNFSHKWCCVPDYAVYNEDVREMLEMTDSLKEDKTPMFATDDGSPVIFDTKEIKEGVEGEDRLEVNIEKMRSTSSSSTSYDKSENFSSSSEADLVELDELRKNPSMEKEIKQAQLEENTEISNNSPEDGREDDGIYGDLEPKLIDFDFNDPEILNKLHIGERLLVKYHVPYINKMRYVILGAIVVIMVWKFLRQELNFRPAVFGLALQFK